MHHLCVYLSYHTLSCGVCICWDYGQILPLVSRLLGTPHQGKAAIQKLSPLAGAFPG